MSGRSLHQRDWQIIGQNGSSVFTLNYSAQAVVRSQTSTAIGGAAYSAKHRYADATPPKVDHARAKRKIVKMLNSTRNEMPVSIADIAELVWKHSHSIDFGSADSWDDSLFTAGWGASRQPDTPWRSYGQGWYWFLADLSFDELRALDRPSTLPLKGCDVGATSRSNLETFGPDLLCKANEDGRLVVYNGHENSVCSRVRSHFALSNDSTGALGLQHFDVHDRTWEVKVFAAPCLDKLPHADRPRVDLLMSSKSGRCAVESAWRASYGWPVLCKG